MMNRRTWLLLGRDSRVGRADVALVAAPPSRLRLRRADARRRGVVASSTPSFAGPRNYGTGSLPARSRSAT